MSQYEPLEIHLRKSGRASVCMTFDEIKDVIGELPSSAFRHRPWWANDRSHIQAHSWLRAGYRTENVDMAGRKLVFRKSTMR